MGCAHATQYASELKHNFGTEFVTMLISAYLSLGGLVGIVYKASVPYYLDYLRASGVQYQRSLAFASAPWTMKPLFGVVSDTFPICGWHKAPYIVFVTVMGVVAQAALATLPLRGEGVGDTPGEDPCATPAAADTISEVRGLPTEVWVAQVLFLIVVAEIAMKDLLFEGRYSAEMRGAPATGPSLVTLVGGCFVIGNLLLGAATGPIADSTDPRIIFYLGIAASVQALCPLFLGYLGEPRVTSEPKWEKVRHQPRMYLLAVLMTLGSASTAFASLFLDGLSVAVLAWGGASVLLAASYWVLPATLAGANVYMFLSHALQIDLSGALAPWYKGDETCVPGGPHFSNTYYITYSGVVGGVATLIAIAAFQVIFRNSSFRKAFWVTTLLSVTASMFDLLMVTRIHRPMIPDVVMFLFGNAMIYELLHRMNNIPSYVLVSKVCPTGYECIVFSLLAGYQSLGIMVSKFSGVSLMQYFDVHADKCSCRFDNLPLLILVGHFFLPILCVPLTFLLIPNARLTDDLHKMGRLSMLHESSEGISKTADAVCGSKAKGAVESDEEPKDDTEDSNFISTEILASINDA